MASEAKNQRANSPFKDELRLGGFGLKRLIDLPIAWPEGFVTPTVADLYFRG